MESRFQRPALARGDEDPAVFHIAFQKLFGALFDDIDFRQKEQGVIFQQFLSQALLRQDGIGDFHMLAQLHGAKYSILVRVVPFHAENGIWIHLRKVDGHGEVALEDPGIFDRRPSLKVRLHFFDLGEGSAQAAGFLEVQGPVDVLGTAVHAPHGTPLPQWRTGRRDIH